MENTSQPNMTVPTQPVPSPGKPVQFGEPVEVIEASRSSKTGGIILIALLIGTFFTPLGPILFLPTVIYGLVVAAKYVKHEGERTAPGGHSGSLLYLLIKTTLIVGSVIVCGILALIAFLFIGISTGFIDFRMGS